jgi:hypothetical protein
MFIAIRIRHTMAVVMMQLKSCAYLQCLLEESRLCAAVCPRWLWRPDVRTGRAWDTAKPMRLPTLPTKPICPGFDYIDDIEHT